MKGGLKLWDLRKLATMQGIEIGPARAEEAIRRDELLHSDLLSGDGKLFIEHLIGGRQARHEVGVGRNDF